MANILFLTNRFHYPLTDGGALRVFYLSREISKKHRCFLAAFSPVNEHLQAIQDSKVYTDVLVVPPEPVEDRKWQRHFRLSDEHYMRIANPNYYMDVVKLLEECVLRWSIDTVVAVNLRLSEFIVPLGGVKKIVDDYDCQTLTKERFYQQEKRRLNLRQKFKYHNDLMRVRKQERVLTRCFDLVTTISPADKKRLQELSESLQEKILIVPNGINPRLAEDKVVQSEKEEEKAIIFWGNLNFPPNAAAVKFFFNDIYVPYLEEKEVKWYIVGGYPSEEIKSFAGGHPLISVTGIIEDLYAFASSVPVMINPMVMGSGLKNKVLEAFALRRAVVSNRMGIESIAGAKPGVHFRLAEKPADFADAILLLLDNTSERKQLGERARQFVLSSYTWEKVVDKFIPFLNGISTSPEKSLLI